VCARQLQDLARPRVWLDTLARHRDLTQHVTPACLIVWPQRVAAGRSIGRSASDTTLVGTMM
jgi:hypothetical protein